VYDILLRSLIACLAVSLSSSVAGSMTIFRKASFLVAGASHSALAGAAVAVFLNSIGFELYYFPMALAFASLAALLASYSARRGDINTGIAVSFAFSMSIAVIALSATKEYASKAWQLFFGDMLLLTDTDIVVISVSTSILLIFAAIYYYKFIFISFDPEGAEASNVNLHVVDLLLITLISISVVSALKAVGAILVFAIFVAPAAAAREVGRSIESVFYFSFIIALMSLLIGLGISSILPIPAGALAALLVSSLYFFVTVFRNSN